MFVAVLIGLAIVCAILYFYTSGTSDITKDKGFCSFQTCYLVVYTMAVAGDWLQGPHVYALYQSYGMSKQQIEMLFVAGFGSSLLFGTVIGSFADKFGRRNNCILYAILYGAACITKHFSNIWILLVGRFLGGIATSILFSAFESWVVYEHNQRGFSSSQLSVLFSNAALGNSLIAIVSGIFAQFLADKFGFVAPFDASLTVLVLMAIVALWKWPENYGNEKGALKESFAKSIEAIKSDSKVLCLGLVQSLFEGSMYMFVIEWTPSMEHAAGEGAHIPHGFIFAAFMVACMIGSCIFKILSRYCEPECFMRFVLLLSAACFGVPIVAPNNVYLVFGAFLVFEICVGLFWPSMGCMRGAYLPEAARSTTINLFRIPLNLIVVVILLMNFSMFTIFVFCVVFLLVAAVAQQIIFSKSKCSSETNSEVYSFVDVHPAKILERKQE